jgi:hypothetical protein
MRDARTRLNGPEEIARELEMNYIFGLVFEELVLRSSEESLVSRVTLHAYFPTPFSRRLRFAIHS